MRGSGAFAQGVWQLAGEVQSRAAAAGAQAALPPRRAKSHPKSQSKSPPKSCDLSLLLVGRPRRYAGPRRSSAEVQSWLGSRLAAQPLRGSGVCPQRCVWTSISPRCAVGVGLITAFERSVDRDQNCVLENADRGEAPLFVQSGSPADREAGRIRVGDCPPAVGDGVRAMAARAA
jgi:hypothetical protein